MASIYSKKMSLMLIVLGLSMLLEVQVTKAWLPRYQQSTKDDGSLSFLVVGDWGRKGAFNQSFVATQMGIVGDELDVDFIISTGDNFYDDGLTGVNDTAFTESFSNIYTAPSLQKQWYTVLGNHDYRGDVLAQMDPVLRKLDCRWLCLRSYIVNADIVDFFFVDTTPFVNKYYTDQKHTYDWRGILPQRKYISNLLKDVDHALKKSTAKWKFVIGHHTIKSAGSHGNTTELVEKLLPILKANDVDLYINGHDHCVQHISSSDSALEFLTSGGGSKAWTGIIEPWNPNELKLYYDGQGFMSLQVTQTKVDGLVYDVFGNILHHWNATKSGY
ncbi:hypothetical protein RND81_09G221100 [Saponaria officinalis]|uniref:Purple acid phosphatase n=1 Tax=Saponaria officinalis TaxID=3572 RepID=A0AAW1IP59_SAPOF